MNMESRPLPNGTTLHLVDASRPQTPDRWIVVLEARIDIFIDARLWPSEQPGGPTLEALHRMLGPRVTYVSRKERVFVPVGEKEQLLEVFKEEFRRHSLPYLSLPAFPVRFVLKQYREIQKRQSWRPAKDADPDQDA